MGMGMGVSSQIWQQFVDLVCQDDLIKCKQNFDIIMDYTFIHSTAEEHMDDLLDLLKVLQKYGLKILSWPENQGILFFIYFSNISNEPDIFHGCTS